MFQRCSTRLPAPLQDLLAHPQLPPNAQYIKTSACTGTWGAIGAAMAQLPVVNFEYFVVVDSSAKGPFMPVYAQQVCGCWAPGCGVLRLRLE